MTHDCRTTRTEDSAAGSVPGEVQCRPFGVATALVGGRGLSVCSSDFTDHTLRDPERLRLAGQVKCRADEEATEILPHDFPAVLTLRLRDGSERSERMSYNRAGLERPVSPAELATEVLSQRRPSDGSGGVHSNGPSGPSTLPAPFEDDGAHQLTGRVS